MNGFYWGSLSSSKATTTSTNSFSTRLHPLNGIVAKIIRWDSFVRKHQIGANPERSDFVNFRGLKKFSELCVLLFAWKEINKMLPKPWFCGLIFGHIAGSTKLDRPYCKRFRFWGIFKQSCALGTFGKEGLFQTTTCETSSIPERKRHILFYHIDVSAAVRPGQTGLPLCKIRSKHLFVPGTNWVNQVCPWTTPGSSKGKLDQNVYVYVPFSCLKY